MENMNSFLILYLLSPATLALASYSGLFETYVLYIASKETDFFTIVVFQDLGYVTADGEKVGSVWLKVNIGDMVDEPVKAG